MGILDEMPEDGSAISVEDLAARVKASPELVGMFQRLILLPLHFVEPLALTA
jgi:hypothetical protein